MGFLEDARKSLAKAVDQHGDKIEKGAEQLSRTINDKTGNKHADKVAKGRDQLRKGLRSLSNKPDGPAGPQR
jgi:hypothetical protein